MQVNVADRNLLLRVASRAKRRDLERKLKHVVFEAGQQIWPAGVNIPYALFPLRGIISLQMPSPPAKQVGIAVVGREGFALASLHLGASETELIAIGITPGEAVTMPPDVFRGFLTNAGFKVAIERYIRLYLVMVSNISVCNRIHGIDELFVGRLLLIQDRTESESFQLTQEFLSRLLGVRKASISRAAVRLQRHGAIEYDRRGRLRILDRHQLEKLGCSCYDAMKAEFDRFTKSLGGI
jgi:hypothetical protein